MKLKEHLENFRGDLPDCLDKEKFDNLGVVFISEDTGGKHNHNFIYIDARGNEKNYGKPLTTHFLTKCNQQWVLVTRHNRIRKFNTLCSKRTDIFYFLTTNCLLKQLIWKDEKLYEEFRNRLILEMI
jgi:hypothetical protein